MKLGDLCKLVIGRTPPRKESRYWGGQHGWATIRDITASDGVVRQTQATLTDLGAEYCGDRLLPPGTLMFSFKLSIGQTAFAGCPLYTNEAIVGLHPLENDLVDHRYLRWALQAVDYGELVGYAAKGRTLNKRTLAMLEIPLAPSADQHRIAAALERQANAVKQAKEAAQAQLTVLDALWKKAVQQAFRP